MAGVFAGACLLSGTAAGLLVLHLLYVQVNDTYIMAFMPFGLLAFACDDQANPARPAALSWSVAASGVFILAFSLFIRGVDAGIEAQWKAAERLIAAGIPDTSILATYPWQVYHGAFDQWIDAGAPGLADIRPLPLGDRMHEPFSGWLRKTKPQVHLPHLRWNPPRQLFRQLGGRRIRPIPRPHLPEPRRVDDQGNRN